MVILSQKYRWRAWAILFPHFSKFFVLSEISPTHNWATFFNNKTLLPHFSDIFHSHFFWFFKQHKKEENYATDQFYIVLPFFYFSQPFLFFKAELIRCKSCAYFQQEICLMVLMSFSKTWSAKILLLPQKQWGKNVWAKENYKPDNEDYSIFKFHRGISASRFGDNWRH